MNVFTNDKRRNESQYQWNVGSSNHQTFRIPRHSIEVPIMDGEKRKRLEDKISVDMMRRLTTFDNRQLVDFVKWLNTSDHKPKNNFFRSDRGNSIPEGNIISNGHEYHYEINHQTSLNKSSLSYVENNNGGVPPIKGKGSGDNRKNFQNIPYFEKRKFRASSITGTRNTNNNYATISKKNSLQCYSNNNDETKERRKSLANFRSKSSNRRVSGPPVRNLL
uniref:Uncharacterized protein n=1 Tax=Strongyloides papillosus TaxID=174720 RepID=A0A0N5CHR5_STREA